MKKRLPIILVLALVAGAVGWRWSHRSPFVFAGTVEATRVDLSPQLTSPIATVEVREGEAVKKGQIVVTLAGDDFRLAADIAERDYRRGQTLRESGSLPLEAFDRLKFKRDDAALRVKWLTLTSPINGVVLDRYHEPGELVNPSMKLLSLADLSEVWAYVYVPQPMLARIKVDMSVDGLVPEAQRTVSGRISHIRDEAEFTPKNVQTREERTRLVYGVKVAFANPDGFLKPGMTVEIKLPE